MEDKCVYCEAFESFKESLVNGGSMEDAFHESVKDLIQQAFSDAFDDGYISAMANIRDLAQRTIVEIIEQDECDCEECNCSCE